MTTSGLDAPVAGASFVARIAGAHGYRIDGDRAWLDAEIDWGPGAVAWPEWSLELWAQPPGADEDAVKVAELPVAVGQAQAQGSAAAAPPAGSAACVMTLLLRAGRDVVQDRIVFPREERFLLPRLEGSCAYRFDGATVELRVESIANPRDRDNLSGDLALELWALSEPYRGGAFAGVRVGAAALGRLAGQDAWHDVGMTVAAAPLPPGRWHLALMLREWTQSGSITRDHLTFAAPHDSGEDAATHATDLGPSAAGSIEAALQDSAIPAMPQAPASATAPAAPAAEATPPQTLDAVPEPPAAQAPAALPDADDKVSVNAATEAQLLAGMKGLSRLVAKAIVAARPHATLEALLDVKGIGPRLLARWRDRLKL